MCDWRIVSHVDHWIPKRLKPIWKNHIRLFLLGKVWAFLCDGVLPITFFAVFTEDPEPFVPSSCHSDKHLLDCPQSKGWLHLGVFPGVHKLYTGLYFLGCHLMSFSINPCEKPETLLSNNSQHFHPNDFSIIHGKQIKIISCLPNLGCVHWIIW